MQFLIRLNPETENVELIFNEVGGTVKLEKSKLEKWITGDYFSKITHDLANPLITIKELMKILRKKLIKPNQNFSKDEIHKTAEHIRIYSKYLFILIRDFSDKSRFQSFDNIVVRKKIFNLRELINLTLEIVKTRAYINKKNIIIHSIIDDNVPEQIYSDFYRLIQVLNNIVSNSFNFTDSGWIKIIIHKKIASLNILGLTQDKEVLMFYIIDNGIGIPKEQLEAINIQLNNNEKKETDKEFRSSLGLPVCKEIIDKIGYNFVIESDEDNGTIVKFMLNYTDQTNLDLNCIDININGSEIVVPGSGTTGTAVAVAVPIKPTIINPVMNLDMELDDEKTIYDNSELDSSMTSNNSVKYNQGKKKVIKYF